MKPILVTMGEPAGIGGEITLKAWQNRHVEKLPDFCVLGDPDYYRAIDPTVLLKIISRPEEAQNIFDTALPIIPINLKEPATVGSLNQKNGEAVIESITSAVNFCLSDEASAVVTNPIHKAALYEAGFAYPGHTEFVAHLCGDDQTPVMMLTAKDLRVVPLTIHIPLKDVPQAITQKMICEKLRIVNESLKQNYKIASPRIAVCGLNPHAGEQGKIGLEEGKIILPALEQLKAEGIHVSGPHSADTMFHEAARASYDIAIGMYHDQALIPVKTLDFYGGVNVTLGLKVVRTSPDHGTAIDIAGQNKANPQSLINAIKMAADISKNRAC